MQTMLHFCAIHGIIKEVKPMKLNFSPKTIETVKSYTYMTGRFMTMAFDKPVAQHILSVIMGKNLIVKSVKSQPVEDNFLAGVVASMF